MTTVKRRVKLQRAMEMLDVQRPTLLAMAERGLFTLQQDCDGGDRYIRLDEIEAWLTRPGTPREREAAQRAFIASRQRKQRT